MILVEQPWNVSLPLEEIVQIEPKRMNICLGVFCWKYSCNGMGGPDFRTTCDMLLPDFLVIAKMMP